MNYLRLLFLAFKGITFILITSYSSYSQCSDPAGNGVNQGNLSIDGNSNTYQTVAITGQDYFSVSVTCGEIYYFDFCGNGGSTSGIWPVITILDASQNVLDWSPYTGGCSQISYAATFTGTITVYITDDLDGCTGAPAWTGTMAYNDGSASIVYNNITCSSADATLTGISGGSYSFNPAPGGSVSINASTGDISNGTPGVTYTVDYTEATCGNTISTSVTLTAADATFTMSSTSCTTAAPIITGTTGGTFDFAPGSGGGPPTIDPNTGIITSGTPGATYDVEYTICNVTTTESVTLSSGDASFSLSVSCGGATASISGDTGGTFAFNPAPGDGAQINATTGTVSNGTAGTTYTVEYTVCGTSSTESVTVLTDDCWSLNGDAQYINVSGENCIQLTDEVNNQTGCAWSGSQIDFNSDFSLSLDYYFGNNIGGADGNTFTFQPSASTACGQDGGQLGAGGLTNALSIEFDTYDNDYPSHVYDMSCDHVAIETDGDHQNGTPAAGPACAKSGGGNIDDGGLYEVEIVWDASALLLEVYFDGVFVLNYTDDIINNVFGGQNLVYWGATSATGGLNNQQYFCPSSVVILPVGLSAFSSSCNGTDEVFTWTTETEENVDHFVLEYTFNGTVFFPEVFVDAGGNSTEENTYTARVNAANDGQRYYRLKVVDGDGSIHTSDLISSRNCANTSLIKSMSETENAFELFVNGPVDVVLINMMGQIISDSQHVNTSLKIGKEQLATGMYQLMVNSADGTHESRKIVLQ